MALRIVDLATLSAHYQDQIRAKLATQPAPRATQRDKPPLRPCHHGCNGTCIVPYRYELVWHGKPLSTNGELKGERKAGFRASKETHAIVRALVDVAEVPTVDTAFFELVHIVPDRRTRDWDGILLWWKHFQDGLVHAGVLPDDHQKHALGGFIPRVVYEKGQQRVEVSICANMGIPNLTYGGIGATDVAAL